MVCSAGEYHGQVKLVSAQQTFSLFSVHTPDKLSNLFRPGPSPLSTLESGVNDRGVSISASAVSSSSDRQDAVDEGVA